MKHIFSILLILAGFMVNAQSTGHFRYDTAKFYKVGGSTVVKVEGALQATTSLTIISTTGTAPGIGQSFNLGTISSDQTITFPTLESGRNGTFIFVENSNVSAFVWNVAGPVIEGQDQAIITTLPKGLHIFKWNGTNWVRANTSGGATPTTDTLTFTYPLEQINKNVRLNTGGFPRDTCYVAIHGVSLWNVCYFTATTTTPAYRDSAFIVDLVDGSEGTTWDGRIGGTAFSTGDMTLSDPLFVQYVFTGSSPSTFTLPVLLTHGNTTIFFKNKGSAALTIDGNASDQIYTTSAVNTITLQPGDGTFLMSGSPTAHWNAYSMGGGSYTGANGIMLDGTTFKMDNAFTPITDEVHLKMGAGKSWVMVDNDAELGMIVSDEFAEFDNNNGNVFGVNANNAYIVGHTTWNTTTYALDADFDLSGNNTVFPFIKLTATLTANRTLTMPSGVSVNNEFCTLNSLNTDDDFKWQLTGADVYEMNGTQIVELNNNETYDLTWDAGLSRWLRKSGNAPANLIMNNSGTSGQRTFWYRNDSAFIKRLIDGANISTTTTGVAGSGDSTITLTAIPTGTTGKIQYNNGGSFGAASLYWDAANTRLGNNISAPSVQNHISVDGVVPAAGIIPGGLASVLSNSGAASFGFITAGSNTSRGVLTGTKARGTLAAPTTVAADDYLLSIGANAYDGTTLQNTGIIHFQVDGAVSSGTAGTKIVFRTGATNSASLADRFSISKSGVINIANTSGTGNRLVQTSSAGDISATTLTILTGSATLDFTSTAAQTSSELTITVTGAVVNDVVSVGPPAAPNANSSFSAYVSATNTVTVRFNNYSSGAIDPASATYKVTVTHF